MNAFPFFFTSCQISLFYIKPQLLACISAPAVCCQISLFYIKPQLMALLEIRLLVVKYHFSTSNHNTHQESKEKGHVVKYHFSTSNHNYNGMVKSCDTLSNITFLHQTTTLKVIVSISRSCQISLFYIKPQLVGLCLLNHDCCQISLFYIKPQLNQGDDDLESGCQISLFYIKPQHEHSCFSFLIVVKYHFSTSNHNQSHGRRLFVLLSNITFLHQTTTTERRINNNWSLSNITFLHQTTTRCRTTWIMRSLSNITFLHQTTTGFIRKPRN